MSHELGAALAAKKWMLPFCLAVGTKMTLNTQRIVEAVIIAAVPTAVLWGQMQAVVDELRADVQEAKAVIIRQGELISTLNTAVQAHIEADAVRDSFFERRLRDMEDRRHGD